MATQTIFKHFTSGQVQIRTFPTYKKWGLTQANSEIEILDAIRQTGSAFYPNTEITTSGGIYKRTLWDSIYHLYYANPSSSFYAFEVNDRSHRTLSKTARVLSISQDYYGDRIRPKTVRLASIGITLVDDGYGNLYNIAESSSYASSPMAYVRGNVIYSHGNIIVNAIGSYASFATSSFTLSFRGSHTVTEREFTCEVWPGEFNFTLNRSALSESVDFLNVDGQYNTYFQGNDGAPYVTTIGLYDDYNNLLAIGKVARPIRNNSDLPLTFIVRLDT